MKRQQMVILQQGSFMDKMSTHCTSLMNEGYVITHTSTCDTGGDHWVTIMLEYRPSIIQAIVNWVKHDLLKHPIINPYSMERKNA